MVTSGISIQHQTRLGLILLNLSLAWLQQGKLYTSSYESSEALYTGQSIWITFIPQFNCWKDCIMICIWEPVEQHVLPELNVYQKSTFQHKMLGNMSTMPWKYLPLRTAFLDHWLLHIFGLIMHQSPFSVQYMTFNLSKQGSEIYLGTTAPMSRMPEKSLVSWRGRRWLFISALITLITNWVV